MMDMTAYLERVPAPGETVVGRSFSLGFGGKGANQAVMAARLGADVEMVACVGSDVFGAMTVENLKSADIGTEWVREIEGESSGVAPIWIEPTGENRIVIVPGANLELDVAHVDAAFRSVGEVDVVICQLEIPLASVERAIGLASEMGASSILNPAPAASVPRRVLERLSWLIPNESEFELVVADVLGTEADGTEAQLVAVSEELAIGVILTLGAEGCAIVQPSEATPVRIAAPLVPVRDTSGAGDAFIGAFAYALGRGFQPATAAQFACNCASASVSASGTQSSFPRGPALEALVSALEEERAPEERPDEGLTRE
jgi:ribokinase